MASHGRPRWPCGWPHINCCARGSEPILILDDVFAELDVARQRPWRRVASTAEQVLITAAVPGDVRAIGLSAGSKGSTLSDGVSGVIEPAAEPPEHLSHLPGMDLVRRALEEARATAGSGQGGWSSGTPPQRPATPRATVVDGRGPVQTLGIRNNWMRTASDLAKVRAGRPESPSSVFGEWEKVVGEQIATVSIRPPTGSRV